MDKINKNYGENPDKMTGTPNGSKSQNYGQTTNQESWKDRVADKVDNAASKVADKVDNAANKMADKVHEKVAQHKSGTTDSSSRMDHNGMKKHSENCGCSASEKGNNMSGGQKPEQGKTSY